MPKRSDVSLRLKRVTEPPPLPELKPRADLGEGMQWRQCLTCGHEWLGNPGHCSCCLSGDNISVPIGGL